MRRRGSAAAAKNAHAERGRFAREEREVFRRGFWINDAVAFALRESCVGHAANAKIIHGGQLLQNRQKRLRAERAVRADDLDILVFQLRRGIGGTNIAVRRAFFGVGELRDDRQAGERTNRINGNEQFLDVRKRFQNVEIHAALFERERLLVKNVQNFLWLGVARLHAKAQRADGAGNKHFARGGFARFAGDLHAAAVEPLDFVAEAEGREDRKSVV